MTAWQLRILIVVGFLSFWQFGSGILFDEFFMSKPTAIVVGAGHYPGYNGLLKLLEHQGYKLEQL